MVQCFAPDCKHQSESHICRFFSFPSKTKKHKEYQRWIRLIRRQDREPNEHSRVCSCHFRDGQKSAGPELFERNANKIFESVPTPAKRRSVSAVSTITSESVGATAAYMSSELPQISETSYLMDHQYHQATDIEPKTATECENTILKVEMDMMQREMDALKLKLNYRDTKYSAKDKCNDVIRMETGLPTSDLFYVVVRQVKRHEGNIVYYAGWKVDCIELEDQVFITLMKLRQNYTNLHLAQLYNCSTSTISNIIITFINVLHSILFKNIMTIMPSREKNKCCSPASFSEYMTCRVIIDCTDIEIAIPALMSEQNVTYSSYRGMNSFKMIVGVAPNAVITYVSPLYPGSTSDKEIVIKSGLLDQLESGDLVLADKGFLIQDVVPAGVSVNIPPFLQNGKFTESEAQVTKSIAKCRIHVERANARLKDFKILSFVPPYLRCHIDTIFQLCAALVNLQFPLIKECCSNVEFE